MRDSGEASTASACDQHTGKGESGRTLDDALLGDADLLSDLGVGQSCARYRATVSGSSAMKRLRGDIRTLLVLGGGKSRALGVRGHG